MCVCVYVFVLYIGRDQFNVHIHNIVMDNENTVEDYNLT